MPEQDSQNNNVLENGLSTAHANSQTSNETENNISSDKLFVQPLNYDIQKKFDDLSRELKQHLQEQATSVFERVQFSLAKLEKQVAEITTAKKTLEDKIQELEKKNNDVIEMSRKAKKEMGRMSREVKVTERKSLEFLGIFVTLFTFISVSASTVLQFKNVHHSVFFLASFCFCLLLFLHLFHLVLRNEKIGKKCWVVFYIIALTCCGGGAILCYHHGNKTTDVVNEKNNSIQINYTQTNEYEQTVAPIAQPPQRPTTK